MASTSDKNTSADPALVKSLMKVCEALENHYGRRKHPPFADYLEALAFQILELGASEKQSKDALVRLRAEYIDWNDMRVATIREIEDILGVRYPKCREKAEDLKHLLSDIYTAFRRMDVGELLAKGEGIETLRALPDVTNLRLDMVNRAFLIALGMKVMPIDGDQFAALKHLGGVPKAWTMQQGVKKIEESLDLDQMARLSRVLREHVHLAREHDLDDPQAIGFETKLAKKTETAKVEKKPEAKKPETAKVVKKDDRPEPAKVEKKPETAKVEKKPEAKKPEPKKPEAKPASKAPAKPAAKAAPKKK